jgi:branched-chain amino acid transport system substrate-binding protein
MQTTRFWGSLAALACGVLLLNNGCGRSPAGGQKPGSENASRPGAAAENSGPAGEPIKVGHFASMTGSEATWGVSTDTGIRFAIDEQNAAGGVNGRPIDVITYDNQGKQQESATAVTRLVTQDKVVAVLGEVASSRSIAGGQVAQRFGVPLITPSSTNPRVTEIGDMVFRVCFIDPFQGYVCAKFARDDLKLTRAATLFNRAQAYSTGLNDYFKKHFTEMGGTIVTEQAYGDGDTDFSAQLANIRDANPEIIFIPGYYTEVVNIAVQARRLGITLPLLGGDGWDAEDLKNAGSALDGSYFSNHYSHEEQRPVVQDFVKRYQAKYGKIPDGMAATGYDAARILIDAMQRAKSLNGKDLAKALAETKNFPGVTGIITMDAQRNAHKPAVILKLKDGKPSYVTTIQPPAASGG